MLNQRPLTNPTGTAGRDRRRPLSDITSASLNRITTTTGVTDTIPGQPKVPECEPSCDRNPPEARNSGGVCAPRDFAEPILRLSVHKSPLLKPIPIWDVRCRALWCMELSSFDILVDPAEVLPPSIRYRDVVHPCLANNLAWLTSQNEELYAHFTALEQEPRYQWDLSYVHRLKKVTGADRAEIVDIMIRRTLFLIYFGMRVRLHHPTVHVAVSILDRYLSSLFGNNCANNHNNDVGESEAVKELLRRPYAMKSLACACIWLAARLEETQKHFDPQWFHEVLFLRTSHPPTVPQLSQLMNNVAQVLDYDLLAPTVHTFLCRLVPLAKFSGEDVQVARCLSERALLEPLSCPTNTTPTQTNNTTSTPSSAILGVYLPSCIAAACVFLARAHMLALRHHLPATPSCDGNMVTTESSGKPTEEVWTAALTRFSGYTAAQLQPCAQALHGMLQLETYHRARLYAHTLCPSGSFDDLEVTIQAMTGSTSQCDNGGSITTNGEGALLHTKNPLKEYLKLLPQILLHMQSAIVSSVDAMTTTVEPIHTAVPILPNITIVTSTSSVQSVTTSSSAATTIAATIPYVPRFRTFGRTLTTDSSATTTAIAVNATAALHSDENNSQQILSFGSQFSEVSQLTNIDCSQSTVPHVPATSTTSTTSNTYSRVPSRQVSERTVETVKTVNSGNTSMAGTGVTTIDVTTTTIDGPVSKRLRTYNQSFPMIASVDSAITSSTYATTTTASTYPYSNNENSFFDPAQLMYSQDGLSNPFPQYVQNSTQSKEGTSFSSFASVLGKRRKGDLVNSVVPGTLSTNNIFNPISDPPQSVGVLALKSHLQDLYKIYTSFDNYSSTNIATTATTTASIEDLPVPSFLDYCIANTTKMPTMRESVRLKYYSVYGRLVTCPPM